MDSTANIVSRSDDWEEAALGGLEAHPTGLIGANVRRNITIVG